MTDNQRKVLASFTDKELRKELYRRTNNCKVSERDKPKCGNCKHKVCYTDALKMQKKGLFDKNISTMARELTITRVAINSKERRNDMKVFINKRVGNYSGGMAIVAANNVEEAQRLLIEALPDSSYMIDKDGNYCHNEEECVEIRNFNYREENWLVLSKVTSDYTIPTFIAEDGYSE